MLWLIPTLLLIALVAWYAHGVLRLAVAYKAKILCSGLFVAGRPAPEVLASDLSLDNHRLFRWIPVRIDAQSRRVDAGWSRYLSGTAIDRPGMGCTLIRPALAKWRIPAYPFGIPADAIKAGPMERRPLRCRTPGDSLAGVLAQAFQDDPARLPQRTRAIVIVHRGQIVGERYAPGFGPESPIAGWSLAKVVINALAGILVREGRLALSDPAPVAAWSRPGDSRRAITVEHLLRMTSGLRFSETYRDLHEDVMQMLLAEPDCSAFAAAKPLDHAPGSRWQYSGGSSNILSGVFKIVLGEEAYLSFPRLALFEPLRMGTAILEMDASGHFVGSSFMYASARDWARLGLLYLRDGMCNGRRILPEGWVDFSRSPTPQSPNGEFGAHFWLRVSGYYQAPDRPQELPAGTFHGIGYEGQFISVVPAEDLVVVRLGLTRRAGAWVHDRFLAEVIRAVRSGE